MGLQIQPTPARVAADPDIATLSDPRPTLAVPLRVQNPSRSAACQPVTVGIPLPRRALFDPGGAALRDAEGEPVALQTSPLALWPDGSIKWMLLDFVVDGARVPEPEPRVWTLLLRTRPGGAAAGPGISIQQSAKEVIVQTGAATFRIPSDRRSPLLQAGRDGREPQSAGRCELTLADARGRASRARIETARVEARGPVRASVRLAGRFPGRAACRFVARLDFFAGSARVRAQVTLHNPRRARHRGGLWDLGDPGSILFQSLVLNVDRPGQGSARVGWVAEDGQPARWLDSPELEIYQDSSGGANWQSRNHLNRQGRVPCTFRGYRVRGRAYEGSGLRASPVVTLQAERGGISAAVPEFWQQFPKAITTTADTLSVGLFPDQFGDLHELQGGEQKTHTAWLDFDAADRPGAPLGLDWVHRPVAAASTPEWYAESGAIPGCVPAEDVPAHPLDALIQEAGGVDGLLARREIIDDYGWRNFGDVYADHEQGYYDGPPPVISHYNNQYDMLYGFILQSARTGDPRWCELFGPLARHVIDIDIYHTRGDRALYNGGLFWHTDHYKDAATATHRTYSRVNCRTGDRSYGGGPSNHHNYTTGLLHYYYLTGDAAARDAAVGLADWVRHMDDGRRTILGLVDRHPTGHASFTVDLSYHGPGRGCANSLNALLDGWLATSRREYLDKTEELIRRSIHPADDVPARNLLDIERRWSYTMSLGALARYLDLKAEADERDAMYAYAQASLIRYARWMLEHEIPYFDQAEKMEYPTEAWAAQELRKANAFRLAARHAEAPLAADLTRRGHELARRAWFDLWRFETRASARALAVAMVEGAYDASFLARPPSPAPRAEPGSDFGAPETFVPQKHRVLALFRGIRGS